ncbi:DUF805 domain-containing protein [Falsiroseomonas sp. HW251]|uniref:DUF805 domain-containing protein n=1 Tax=Falsiroseomonas sp. HW251 TaxID=3390998 RepID=UPI003D3116FF
MNFMDAVKTCLNNYANFSGRARRSEFWWFVLFNFCAQIAASIVDGIISAIIGFSALSFLVMLGLLVPGIAVSIRRMHDLGKSGWFILLGLIPIAGPIILIVFYVKPGQPGPNQYGPDPLAGAGAAMPAYAAPPASYQAPAAPPAAPPAFQPRSSAPPASAPPASAPSASAGKPRPWER